MLDLLDTNSYLYPAECVKKHLMNLFSIDISDKSLSDKKNEHLLGNDGSLFAINASLEYSDEMCDLLSYSPDIDTAYFFSTDDNILDVRHSPKTLFIDASHELQGPEEEGDRNCVLYGFNFIEGIIKMLKEPRMADNLFNLACAAKSNPHAIEQIQYIFQQTLKSYLPCYYEKDGQRKSSEELEHFHLNQRWQIGSKSISVFHPLKQKEAIVQNTINNDTNHSKLLNVN